MFGKWLTLLLTAAFLASCADPKYVHPSHSIGGGRNQKLNTCQAKFASGHCASYAWEKMPTETEFGTFLFKTFRTNLGDGSTIEVDLEGTHVVVLWMPSMGHGSSPVTTQRLDVGTYRASKIFFTMRGEWEIRIQLKDGNEIKDQAIIPITL